MGRVSALSGAKAACSGNLIVGSCVIAGMSLYVLYDSGATHSFVSESRVQELSLPVKELQYDLTVSIPTSGLVKTSTLCVRCSIVVEGRWFKVNLVRLSLKDLDVILGMDWLSPNHILIDCNERKLLFPNPEDEKLLSSQQVAREVKEGSQCFLVLTQLSVEERDVCARIPVVEKFPDVFPVDVLGYPPKREVEFSIDLVPEVEPMSISPYHMAIAKLAKLKKQIEELLEK